MDDGSFNNVDLVVACFEETFSLTSTLTVTPTHLPADASHSPTSVPSAVPSLVATAVPTHLPTPHPRAQHSGRHRHIRGADLVANVCSDTIASWRDAQSDINHNGNAVTRASQRDLQSDVGTERGPRLQLPLLHRRFFWRRYLREQKKQSVLYRRTA